MPTFWGARMPDQVLSEASYARIVDLDSTDKEGLRLQAIKHFSLRVDWLRDIRSRDYYSRLKNMTEEWALLGMVLPVPANPEGFPCEMRVEQGRSPDFAGADVKRDLVTAIERLATADASLESDQISGLAAGPAQVQPPRRRYRQGEI